MKKIYYLAINPKTGNWCISKTKDVAWSGDNMVMDTGTVLATNAIELVREYSRLNNVVVLNN